MIKILSTIVLVLAVILFPPAALAFISQDAIPGDGTYPIKRDLENIILAVASVNPTSKAWFSEDVVDRRYKETQALLGSGKDATSTLDELVVSADSSFDQINQISDPTQKQKLADSLASSLDKYETGLSLAQQTLEPQGVESTPESTPTPPREISASAPAAQPLAAPSATPTPHPSTSPRPTSAPSTSQIANQKKQQQIEEAKQKLDEVKKKLDQQSGGNQTPQRGQVVRTPTPTPMPTARSSSNPVGHQH